MFIYLRDEYFFKWRKGVEQFAYVHIKAIINQLFYGNKKISRGAHYWEYFSLQTFFVLGGWGTGSLCTGSHEDAEQHDLLTRCQSEWITYYYWSVFPALWSSWEWLSLHFYKNLHKLSLGDGYWIEGPHSTSKGYNCKIEKKMLIDSF